MILAAAYAGAYRAVETHNAALTPSQLRCAIDPRLHHAAVTALDRLHSEGWVEPKDDSPHARLHRGRPADVTPRSWDSPYTPTTATAPNRRTALPGVSRAARWGAESTATLSRPCCDWDV